MVNMVNMVGMGTVINAIGVLIGGICGLTFGKFLQQRYQDNLISASSLCVIFIGITGALQKIFVIEENVLNTTGTMMMIASLCIGAVIGEWLDIEGHTETFAAWLKRKSHSEKDPLFIQGFLSTSLTICIGAMAILGPINDALYHDYTILTTKGILDAIIVMALTASYGKGCIFSVIPLVAFQGTMTLLAHIIGPFMTEAALNNISLVGSMLIFCVGINLIFGKKFKVANMLPALVIAAGYAFIPWLN